MDKRFVYDVMEHWPVPWESYLVAVILISWFVPNTSVQRPSYGKLVYCLGNILLMAYHTSHYINTIV